MRIMNSMHLAMSAVGSSSIVVSVRFADATEFPLDGVAFASAKLSSEVLCSSLRVALRVRGMVELKMGPGQEDQAKLLMKSVKDVEDIRGFRDELANNPMKFV